MLEYKNKRFSILGDSISTLEGYSEPEDAAFYEGYRKFEADVFTPEDTWWGQVISALGGEPLVNNSISGSMVCKHPRCEIPSYGCSDERTSALHRGDRTPDVIFVYMGTNDWGCNLDVKPLHAARENDLSVFSVAYRTMLQKLRKYYPTAEVWCFTLAVSTWKKSGSFVFPYDYNGGQHIEEYCKAIRDVAKEQGCRIIDLYSASEPYDTVDGFHPNKAGMQTLSQNVLNAYYNQKEKSV